VNVRFCSSSNTQLAAARRQRHLKNDFFDRWTPSLHTNWQQDATRCRRKSA